MSRDSSSVNLQDKDTDKEVSIIESDDDSSINAIVVCNADWSNI